MSLAAKLAEVTAATGWIEKRGTAPDKIGGYKFAMAVDIYDKIRTELSSRGVAQTVGINGYVHERQGDNLLTTVTGDLTFIDSETGEIISVPFVGAGMDRGDKGTYKAITGGVRDALKANFLLPTGDDPEAEAPEAPDKPQKVSSAPVPPKAEKTEHITQAQRTMLNARMGDAGLKTAGQKKAFLWQLLELRSSSDATPAQLDKALKELDDAESVIVANARAVA